MGSTSFIKGIILLIASVLCFPACGTEDSEPPMSHRQKTAEHRVQAFIDSAAKGDTESVKIFLESSIGRNIQDLNRALIAAAQENQFTAALLLNYGADPKARDEDGFSVLMHAALRGNYELVQMLLEKGADPQARDQEGRTALISAASGGNVDIVRLFLRLGIDVNTPDIYGVTCLMWASTAGNLEVTGAPRSNRMRHVL